MPKEALILRESLPSSLARDRCIFAIGDSEALAARRATATIPIVAMFVGDPVGNGVIESLARPGGNITGMASR